MKKNKGFTLMEMLIVVAIIAILVAIAIPVLSGALEKSREAADAANIRSAYAECSVAALTGLEDDYDGDVKLNDDEDGYYMDVDATQTQADWQSSIDNIAGLEVGGTSGIAAVTKGDAWTVTVYLDGSWTCEKAE